MIRILVAEDDAVSRELLSEILRSDGYEVVSVADGALAVAEAGAARWPRSGSGSGDALRQSARGYT